jgi:hypothetical protein
LQHSFVIVGPIQRKGYLNQQTSSARIFQKHLSKKRSLQTSDSTSEVSIESTKKIKTTA